MQVIDVLYGVNDEVYKVVGGKWDREKRVYKNYIIEKYRIRSISISCNSKGEWKKSYRAQHVIDDETTNYGINFKEIDVGKYVFTNYEDAEKKCEEMNRN